MFRKVAASTRPHYDTVARLMVHEQPLKIAFGVLICALVWHVGHPIVAVVVCSLKLLVEGFLYLLSRRHGPFAQTDKDTKLSLYFCLSILSVTFYSLPSLYLASAPSIAMKITALVWIMGLLVHLINLWTRLPVFLFGMIIPTLAMTFVMFVRLGSTAPEVSSTFDWGVASGFLLIFVYTALETLRHRLVSDADLQHAQTEATTRLRQLEEAQRIDTLTGLLNRSAFDKAVRVMLQDRRENEEDLAVFMLDLNNFKPINDTYSHEAGDEVLVRTARRLHTIVGDMGVVGRLGGDEFICAVQGLPHKEDLIGFAEDLSRVITGPIHWHSRTLRASASIGIATTTSMPSFPLPTVEALCSAADQAMFAAKTSPDNAPVLFQPDQFARRMTAEDKQRLIDGIQGRALLPFYQPKVQLETGNIVGFEALARWEHPDHGTRYPGEFLEQINDLGLQGDFMVSMANQVVEDIAQILKLGFDPGQVSLNVPEVALATHTGQQDLLNIINKYPDVAKHLTLEITEDVFISRAATQIQASISAFRALGVRISLDDFGTGFASFDHLRQLDFDEMKIDTSFVAGLGHDKTSEVLVRGFLDIAAGIGVNVIAEGIETEAQSRDLIAMGCTQAQGYLFSPAIPFERATAMLSEDQAA